MTATSRYTALRTEVRDFISAELDSGGFVPMCDSWLNGHDPLFSRRLAERGWLGMTFPTKYGGRGRTALERFVVNEELLAAGAPVAAHWVADRQTGPLLLRFGSESQKHRFLPGIARGELLVAIGMSEPDSGSDLASLKTRATKVAGGWEVNGTKVWTSHAPHSHIVVALVRTTPRQNGDRHAGLSQMIIDLASDGVAISPIEVMTGKAHFAEVSFDGVFVPDEMLIGQEGDGWKQVTSELAYERSGPERFLSTYPLMENAVTESGPNSDRAIGGYSANLWALHLLSQGVNAALESGSVEPARPALVKNAGTLLEKRSVEIARDLLLDAVAPSATSQRLLRQAQLAQPGFTLRGGTNEVMRTMIARRWTA